MNPLSSLSFVLSAALFASTASAQSAPACPTLPSDAANLQWTTLRTDSALLCRAMDANGQEAFAVTVARKSPFKPTGSLREESGQMQGQKLWWYRTEIAGRPDELVRETLVKLSADRLVHVFIRTSDKDTMGRYQRVVHGLQFDAGNVAQR